MYSAAALKRRREYTLKWHRDNPRKISEHNRRYRQKHPERVRAFLREKYISYRIEWREWFIENGYIPPSNKFHYHHVNPETKKFKIGCFIGFRACSPRWQEILREELKKCVLMTSLEHLRFHKCGTKE